MSDYEKIIAAFQYAGISEDDYNLSRHKDYFTLRLWVQDKILTFYFNSQGEMIIKS